MKKEKWIRVRVTDPDTGDIVDISTRKGRFCPACLQGRCAKRTGLCIAVQAAMKSGNFDTFTQ